MIKTPNLTSEPRLTIGTKTRYFYIMAKTLTRDIYRDIYTY